MAELIDKGKLDNEHIYVIETDGSIHKMLFCGDSDWEERPVTTLAEIRAKAIDEFAEKLCDAFSEQYGEVTVNGIKFDVLTLDGATEITWEVAEQLKERE